MEIGYSWQVQKALKHAEKAAEDLCNASIGTEHLLIGILKIKEARLSEYLRKLGVTDGTIMQEVQVLFGFDSPHTMQIMYTSTLKDILSDAQMMAHKRQEKEVSMDELTFALLEKDNNVALELLRRSGVVIEELIEEFAQRDGLELMPELRNLNQAVASRKGRTALRDKEIEAMICVLMRMEKSNCVLTGPAGVGKSAIVEELAYRIVKNQVPDELKHCVIAELNVNQMVAGTKYRGEFEKKMQRLVELLAARPDVILFIDELHLIVGAGKAEGSLDIASVLKPVLARGSIRVIGATTSDEYEQWIEKDKALQRRFVRIDVNEPDEKTTLAMLKEKAKDLSAYHNLKLQRGLLKQCVELAGILFPHLHFPDKAIDLLDMTCAASRCGGKTVVTSELLKETAASMSALPFSQEEAASHLKAHLNQKMAEKTVDEVCVQIGKAMKERSFPVVELHENQMEAEVLKKGLHTQLCAKVHEFDASVLNLMSLGELVHCLSKRMNTSHLHVVWINHADELRADLLAVFEHQQLQKAAELNGFALMGKGLCVLFFESQRENIGFLKQRNSENGQLNAWIEIDEQPHRVVL